VYIPVGQLPVHQIFSFIYSYAIFQENWNAMVELRFLSLLGVKYCKILSLEMPKMIVVLLKICMLATSDKALNRTLVQCVGFEFFTFM
jgi:hypothetical protein